MEQITTLKLHALRESPFNPRKSYSEADLAELSQSIASQGVMQPIVVRPAPNRPGDTRNLLTTHEIVFGHRRFRAALLAQLEDVPCIVRDLDDAQTAIAQVHENTQRKDVSAIEEADSFTHLHTVHKMSADAIAAAIGKSRSYVYGRLKIARLAPEVREAVLEQGLPPEIALEVARLPHHNLQRQALKELVLHEYTAKGKEPVGWVSYRQAKRELKDAFDTHLDVAPFDLADSLLVARVGACTTCPRRAGNDPDLAGVLADDVCTDKPCYQIKMAAHTDRQVIALRKAGHEVIEGERAKEMLPHAWSFRPDGMVPVTNVVKAGMGEDGDTSFRDLLDLMGKKAPKTLVIRHPHTDLLGEFITEAQAAEIRAKVAPGDDDEADEGTSTPSSAARAFTLRGPMDLESATPEERAVSSMVGWAKVQAECMTRAAARSERTLDELRLAAHALLEGCYDVSDDVAEGMGWRGDLEQARAADGFVDDEHYAAGLIEVMPSDRLGLLIVLLAIERAPVAYRSATDAAARKLALAAHYGVDVVATASRADQKDDAGHAGDPPDDESEGGTTDAAANDGQLDMLQGAAA